MKQLVSKKYGRRFLLAENEEELQIIRDMYSEHFVFGLYQIWDGREGKGKEIPEIKAVITKFPQVIGIAFINEVPDFVDNKNTVEVNKNPNLYVR